MHLYLHIPYCRKACHYCDFHFSTHLGTRERLIAAMVKEIELTQAYLPQKKLTTIYFGGGTPSILTQKELDQLLSTITRFYTLPENIEITLEANPDDLNATTLHQFRQAGINRLSIGIQTFDNEMLRFLNRTHTSEQAESVVKLAQDTGIDNLSLDLMYALPAKDHRRLEQDLDKITSLGANHLSAYCLTIEPKTAFGNWVENRKMTPIEEEFAAAQFEITVSRLAEVGYEQYEISNFARQEMYSRHNTAYWQRKPYLGIGPGAHSYDGKFTRHFNVSNNMQYINALEKGASPATIEELDAANQTNEYLLTGLRTKWGCDLELLETLSGGIFKETRRSQVKELIAKGWVNIYENTLTLTESGKLFADRAALELFID